MQSVTCGDGTSSPCSLRRTQTRRRVSQWDTDAWRSRRSDPRWRCTDAWQDPASRSSSRYISLAAGKLVASMRLQSVLLVCLLSSGTIGLVADPSPQPIPAPVPAKAQSHAGKGSNEPKRKFASKLKEKYGDINYAETWSKAKSFFWKGVDIMEAVSNKDLNADGKIEGRKGPKTKAEQQAEWKKEHELRREVHEKQFREWAAEKAKGSKDPLAQLSPKEREVIDKLRMLMGNKFNNDHEQMFKHYDADHTSSLQHEEVRQVVKDAGIGSFFTYGMYATKLVARLDINKDKAVQLSEILQAVGSAPSATVPLESGPRLDATRKAEL